MREINHQVVSQVSHTSIDSIKEFIFIKIILWIEPFFLQFPPHCFGNVQMRGIRGKKEDIQTSFLPVSNALQNDFSLMQTSIIQYYKCLSVYPKRKIFHVLQNKLSIYVVFGSFPPAPALSVYQTETIKSN